MTSTSILSRGFRLLTGALPRPTVPAVNKVSANLTSVRNYAKKGKKKGGPQGDPRVRTSPSQIPLSLSLLAAPFSSQS